MLIDIPNKCLTCKKDIPSGKMYGNGLVQMSCQVGGFPPFEIRCNLSWCSVEHFLDWWHKNLGQLNVVISEEEAIQEAVLSMQKQEKPPEGSPTQ
jgi:hypothetical protein